MALLDIRNLTIELETSEGYVRMIDNANLSINEGEIHGLVGESGSGKSLMAKAILGLSHPSWKVSADRMIWDGINLLELSVAERRQLMGIDISMIFQEPSTFLDPSLTIEQQLSYILKPKKSSLFFWQDRKNKQLELKNWLHKVGIKNHKRVLESYPWELSEGACQKIMIMMAIANYPKLLIADEATNMMESSTQAQIFRLLSKLNQTQGLSILLISHDLESIVSWSDKLTVLYCGQTVESGVSMDMMAKPYHPYVQALLDHIAEFGRYPRARSDMPSLKGNIPSLQHLPLGCRLGPRCPYAHKSCIDAPLLKKVKSHAFACHFPRNQEEKTHESDS
tara:strand:+ start:3397 stop:4407 length:1011 start_codon:yes stop_codon:yes gene_type:complete